MTEITTENVTFGDGGTGFLASPGGSGPSPAVIVIQEWWGLDAHIKDVAQRFALEGFIALAPDLYHGKVADEPSEAQKMMMALDMNRAARELIGAAEYLASRPGLGGRGIGATGFCMGGGLALTLACDNAHVKAVAPFYGVNPSPIDKVANITGPVRAFYAEHDQFAGQSVRERLAEALTKHGKRHEIHVYPGTQHAFFNDTRADAYDKGAATDAWGRVLALFRENL